MYRLLQHEKERGVDRETGTEDEEGIGKPASDGGLQYLEKAADGAMPGAMPERDAPNGSTLGQGAGRSAHFTGTDLILEQIQSQKQMSQSIFDATVES